MNQFLLIQRVTLTYSSLALLGVLSIFAFGCGEKPSEGSESGKSSVSKDTSLPGILFFGDSLTAGLGLADPESEAWPNLIGEKLAGDGHMYEIWNAGLSGDTTSGGLGRLDYTLKRQPAIFILELGANDSMRGVPITEIRKNLEAIIDRVREKYPNTKILLVGIRTFPNLGVKYRKEFDSLFRQVSESRKVPLVPFLLEGIAGDRNLNQKDGIHPTEEGHKIMAETVYPYLKKLL